MNVEKSLLLLRNEEYKEHFLFWRKNEEWNNNLSYQEMINKNALNKHWTNFLSKEEEVDEFIGQYEAQDFQNTAPNKLKQTEKTNSREFGWF